MLRWTPSKPGSVLMHNGRKYRRGDTLPGALRDYARDAWPSISEGSSDEGPSAPAPVAKPAPIEAPAVVVNIGPPQASEADIGHAVARLLNADRSEHPALPKHWKRLHALAVRLGYEGDDKGVKATRPYIESKPAAAVADALRALED